MLMCIFIFVQSKYDQLIFRVEEACKSEKTLLDSKEFDVFANSKHNSHDSIVKVSKLLLSISKC